MISLLLFIYSQECNMFIHTISAWSWHTCLNICLVLNSTVAYVEVPTCLPPTMRALVAVGNPITHTHSSGAILWTSANTLVPADLNQSNDNNLVPITQTHGTDNHIEACVENPMHVDAAPSNTIINNNPLISLLSSVRLSVASLRWIPSSLPWLLLTQHAQPCIQTAPTCWLQLQQHWLQQQQQQQ